MVLSLDIPAVPLCCLWFFDEYLPSGHVLCTLEARPCLHLLTAVSPTQVLSYVSLGVFWSPIHATLEEPCATSSRLILPTHTHPFPANKHASILNLLREKPALSFTEMISNTMDYNPPCPIFIMKNFRTNQKAEIKQWTPPPRFNSC